MRELHALWKATMRRVGLNQDQVDTIGCMCKQAEKGAEAGAQPSQDAMTKPPCQKTENGL